MSEYLLGKYAGKKPQYRSRWKFWSQWKFSVVSKKVDYYNYNGKESWAGHCISTLCVLSQWWTESSTASSFLSWGVSMMFDTWSRRLLAGQSRPPCDKCMGQATMPLLVHQMCLENHDEQIRRRDLINPGVSFFSTAVEFFFYIVSGKKVKWQNLFYYSNVESNIVLRLRIDNRKIDYNRLSNWFATPSLIS